MKKKILVYIYFFLTFFTLTLYTKNTLYTRAITYTFNPGGRFGDQVLTYLKAKTIENEYNLPILFKPFMYADMLYISEREKIHYKQHKHSFISHIPIFTELDIITDSITTLYISNLKFKTQQLPGFTDLYRYIQERPAFKATLNYLLEPRNVHNHILLPTDKITVAIHVRKGGGYDKPLYTDYLDKKRNHFLNKYVWHSKHFADKQYPTRFPPESYYIKQLKRLSALLDHQPLFVHIFTDDANPKIIVDHFRKKIKQKNITFSYCTNIKNNAQHVVDDFFIMTHCDCLIRPASSYSKAAQLLGNHKIIIYIKKAHWLSHQLIIEKVGTITNTNNIIKIF